MDGASSRRDTDEDTQVEYTPLITDPGQADANNTTVKVEDMRPEQRRGDSAALFAATSSAVAILAVTWVLVILNQPSSLGWFALHPTLQTLGIVAFTFGIVTLQPTAQPASKVAGLARHQRFMFALGLPVLALGTFMMWLNKTVHNAPHAVTWHGLFGYITIGWVFVQVLVGGGSVWFGGRIFGGGARAKLLWKYHRLSGYLLLALMVLTVHLAGAWSDWVNMVMKRFWFVQLLAYTILPIVLFVAVLARIRLWKMNLSLDLTVFRWRS